MFAAGATVLVLSADPKIVDSTLVGLDAQVKHEPYPAGESKLPFANSSFDGVVSVAPDASFHGAGFFAEALRILKPTGKIILREHVTQDEKNVSASVRLAKEIFVHLTLSGFVNASAELVDGPNSIVQFCASKPAFEVGASTKLNLRPKPVAASNGHKSNGTGTVKISATDDAEDDLIDERELLRPEDIAAAKSSAMDDCGPSAAGPKKACKNCSCGRSKMNVPEASGLTRVVIDTSADDTPKSSCGSCGLGDAFRCSACPYRGLPPFKPGEKVTLQL